MNGIPHSQEDQPVVDEVFVLSDLCAISLPQYTPCPLQFYNFQQLDNKVVCHRLVPRCLIVLGSAQERGN